MKLSERRVLESLVGGDILLLARGTSGKRKVILWPSTTAVASVVFESLDERDWVQLSEVLTIGVVFDITPAGRVALGEERDG